MADDERPAVGTVAEEAARLLDALGGWAATARSGYAAGPADESPPPDAAADADSDAAAAGSRGTAGAAGAAGSTASAQAPDTSSVPEGARCTSCGAENGVGQAVACQLCPVCQGIGLLRSVRPETVDRLADLAGALAATLRDIAGQRRADTGTTAPTGPHDHGSRRPGARVQDIVVDDGDAPGSATS
ncbi:hypothetical protein SAMN04489867_0738 [Pedococcus dokdonensis]|uniref:Uncharacterized protein n=1 Tax=Pedococcus dokdonensis TaxID=443156 RepID=A0A1H0MW41_9MICO|nr:hypothetical protein [Pedococcus dokdonensis]SDO84604.1 hypothetical protein SAMN04489867_0738 [Pedococcus dokdonensis]